jgi:hypothetical protein
MENKEGWGLFQGYVAKIIFDYKNKFVFKKF